MNNIIVHMHLLILEIWNLNLTQLQKLVREDKFIQLRKNKLPPVHSLMNVCGW